MMTKTAKALLLVATCSFAANAAQADVIYTFDGSTPGHDYNGDPITLNISLDITNAAVQRGSFNLSGSQANWFCQVSRHA